jgi:hypothetical protein
MWGTSSPEDKLTGDLGNVIEATSIGGSDFFTAEKLAPGNLGLLQQYRHLASFTAVRRFGRDRSEADMPRASGAGRSDENDPSATSAANFAVMHNAAFSTTMW